jgi:amino acid transporter
MGYCMEAPTVPAVRPRSKLAGLAGFLIGFAVAIGVAALVVWWLFWKSGMRLDMSRPTVVQHIQQLQRLETVVYSMEKIVSGSQESPYLPRLLAGDRILLIVYGEVTAGIDLGHLDAEAVQINGASVELAMPASDIFSTRIDNNRTRVYSRETGLFTSPDPQLESEVRREAERQVRQAALDGGILAAASTNARTTLTTFLKGLGFETVRFR